MRSMIVRLGGLALCAAASLSCGALRGDAPPGELPLLRLEARDFTFSATPRVAAGPTRVRLVNHGPAWHEALITRLPDGVTAEAYLAEARAGKAFPVGAVDQGGPGKVAAGDSSEVVLVLQPGRYVIVCWADDHVTAGMLLALEVAADGRAAMEGGTAAPAPTGEVRLEDFTIVHDSSAYRRGSNVLHVRNTGARPHDLTFYRFAEGKGIQDFGAWYATRQGPPPAVPVGGTATLAPGRDGLLMLNLPPGRYFAGCATPEEGPDGVTLHIQMGMIELFEIE